MRRVNAILTSLPTRPPGQPIAHSRLQFWRTTGGPIDEVPLLVEVLVGADLVRAETGHYQLTPEGRRVTRAIPTDGIRPLAIALLRAGFFHDQARVLLELGEPASDGSITCIGRHALRACPQLIGLLQHWPDVVSRGRVRIPAELLIELEAVWALLPPPTSGDEAEDAIRKTIGNRGELYSYQMLRRQAVMASEVVWVARDDDSLGYDIEDRSDNPRLLVEVKASGSTAVRFFLSENEWRKAHENSERYEIHFWGGIDLARPPSDEYTLLRGGGYPVVFRDLPDKLSGGVLEARPTKWRVVARDLGRSETS